MQLNQSQNEIAAMGYNHIRKGYEQVFEFGGEAGTGKSVVLYDIFRRTGWSMEEILPLAYTGQAAIIMRTKGFYNATTCHSGLFTVEDVPIINSDGSTCIDTRFNIPQTQTRFIPKTSLDKNIKAIFIDEGSMVPYHMKSIIESFGLPVIVAGDPGQLGPVKDKQAYLDREDIPLLTELMRQSENDPIVYLARRARRGLSINTGLYGNNVLVIEEKDLSNDMLRNANLTLCGRNATRDKINKYIRNDILKINNSLPVFGDRLICRKNNHQKEISGINLANGLIGSVVSSPQVLQFDGKNFCIDFLPDLLNIPFRGLSCDYKFFTSPIGNKEYDKYAFGEKFEFAYAITAHLSQGAEADNGIYFEEWMPADIQNKVNYTGITRFKKYLIYVKPNRTPTFYF